MTFLIVVQYKLVYKNKKEKESWNNIDYKPQKFMCVAQTILLTDSPCGTSDLVSRIPCYC